MCVCVCVCVCECTCAHSWVRGQVVCAGAFSVASVPNGPCAEAGSNVLRQRVDSLSMLVTCSARDPECG